MIIAIQWEPVLLTVRLRTFPMAVIVPLLLHQNHKADEPPRQQPAISAGKGKV